MLALLPVALTLAAAIGYGYGVARLRRRGDSWSLLRTICMSAGVLCVAGALLPPLADYDERFPVHVVQHLLLAMVGPVFLALAAPITVALRTVPHRARRVLLRIVHSRAVAAMSAPPTALVLSVGGLYALYLTDWYAAAVDDELVHAAVHLHMFVAGCLLSWAILGIDPVRHRRGVPVRLGTLVLAAAAHDILCKLLYARGLPVGGGSASDRRVGAELMYYGGTVVDVGMAAAVMTQWWLASGRRLAAERRRAAPAASAPERRAV